jgi:hypothetical protein
MVIQKASCPDPAATAACESFRELIRTNDGDFMDDLAHQDHIYVCFLSAKDEFFEVTFSEPTWMSFSPPSAEKIEAGVPRDTEFNRSFVKLFWQQPSINNYIRVSCSEIGRSDPG